MESIIVCVIIMYMVRISLAQYKNQVNMVLRCNGENFDTQLCAHPGTSIRIFDTFAMDFHENNEGGLVCNYHPKDRGISIKTYKEIYKDISDKCNLNQACINLTVKKLDDVHTWHDSDYYMLHFICQEDELYEHIECIGNGLTATMCPRGSLIGVVNAFYGVMNQSQPNATCSGDYASWFDCRFNVEEDYLGRMKRACNNKTACDANLTAECNAKTMNSESCSFLTTEPRDITCADYVMIVYRCNAIAHEWTTESTEFLTLFTTAPESTPRGITNLPDDSSSQLSTALIVGLSMGMCLCAVFIALVVIVVKGKRVQPVLLKSDHSNPVYDEQKRTSGPEVPNSVPLYENSSPRSLVMDGDIVPYSRIEPQDIDFTIAENENYASW